MKPIQLTLILFVAAVCNASADYTRGEVEFSMNAKAKTTKAGTPFELEVEYKIAPGWHIGPRKSKAPIPTELDWTRPRA